MTRDHPNLLFATGENKIAELANQLGVCVQNHHDKVKHDDAEEVSSGFTWERERERESQRWIIIFNWRAGEQKKIEAQRGRTIHLLLRRDGVWLWRQFVRERDSVKRTEDGRYKPMRGGASILCVTLVRLRLANFQIKLSEKYSRISFCSNVSCWNIYLKEKKKNYVKMDF